MSDTPVVPWPVQRRRLERADSYWLSTTRSDGRPHVAPLWGVWFDEQFYFPTDPESVKGRNLAANPRAAIHLDSSDDVLVVEGSVSRVADQTTVQRVDDAMASKYVAPDGQAYRLAMDPANRVWLLRPDRALAWWEAMPGQTFRRWRWNGRAAPGAVE